MKDRYPEGHIYDESVITALLLVKEEVETARSRFPAFTSAHEGLAVIQQEFEELKAEVFGHHRDRSVPRMYQKSIRIAATAVRFMVDVCNTQEV